MTTLGLLLMAVSTAWVYQRRVSTAVLAACSLCGFLGVALYVGAAS